MKKVLIFFVLLYMFVFMGSSCGKEEPFSTTSSNAIYSKVMISINPLKEIAEEIGKGKMDFNTFVPQGVEIHDYEPKVNDMKNLKDYDIFVCNGLNMEPWLLKVIESSPKELDLYNLSDGYDVINENGVLDPHIWMGLTGGEYYGEKIKDVLIKEDPDNKDTYELNYNNFKSKCHDLLTKYKDLFSKLSNKDLVTGHEAFNYLARDFSLNTQSIEDIFSSGEPNAKTLSDLVDFCKKNNVKVIFGEEMVNKEVTDTLAKEVGAKVLVIDTMEYEKEGTHGYLSRMESNLELIYNALSEN